jgi:hypothetical protein
MYQETSNILRRSLDEVDRLRKRQKAAFWVLFCVMVALFVWFGYICGNPTTDVREAILVAAFVLFFGLVYIAMAVAMVQSKMTLKVLQAIELSSKQ